MAEPLDSTYYATLAALNFQKENTLAQDKRGREQTNAGADYSKGQLLRAEPRALQANRNTANQQGLLESGQLADRRGQTQTDYATKQGRIGEQRRQAIAQYNENDQTAGRRFDVESFKAQTESGQRAKEALERNPPAPAGGGYPIPPAQQEAINRGVQPGPGGVVPYESQKVRVGMPLRKQRAEAARKAAG